MHHDPIITVELTQNLPNLPEKNSDGVGLVMCRDADVDHDEPGLKNLITRCPTHLRMCIGLNHLYRPPLGRFLISQKR